ncbi:MAG: hypothetical protein KU37_06080 [Sulfuricurvum sp. PC08-66]|nr:MAG: hypothetical protein KU37_06080 [Sulfuricurvum sp. PC08-66]
MLKKVAVVALSTTLMFGVDFTFKTLLNGGGDKLASFVFTDGSTRDLYAHQGGELAVGVNIPLFAGFDWENSIGMAFGAVEASNGEALFSRVPVESLLQLNMGFLRVGGGVSYHISPRYSCEATNVCSQVAVFNDALGYVAETAIIFDRRKEIGAALTVGARYTWIEYSTSSVKVDGSGWGVLFGSFF